MRVGRPRVQAPERAQIDDPAHVRGSAQKRERCLRGQHGGACVGQEHPVPLLGRDGVELCGFKRARVVDQNVEAPGPAGRLLHGFANGCGLVEVAHESLRADSERAQVRHGGRGFISALVVSEGDIRARPSQSQSDTAADAFRAAGDQRAPASERFP